MKKIFGLANLKETFKEPVVVIGVFDGLHRGHRYLITKAVRTAGRLKKKSVLITFHPHPQGIPYLISLEHRLRLIEGASVDYCLVINFTKEFSRLSPCDFIIRIIEERFSPSFIFVGRNFRFGYKSRGDARLLKDYGRVLGFRVCAIKELRTNSQKIISSEYIRALLRRGKLKEAENLLGRPVSVLGTVIRGGRQGRILGWPTANINPHHEALPARGVYAVKVIYPVGNRVRVYDGICNIGLRPTFSLRTDNQTIEVHLFGFKKNIYGKDVEIRFIRKMRAEKKFPSQFLLIQQIQKDCRAARRILSKTHHYILP